MRTPQTAEHSLLPQHRCLLFGLFRGQKRAALPHVGGGEFFEDGDRFRPLGRHQQTIMQNRDTGLGGNIAPDGS